MPLPLAHGLVGAGIVAALHPRPFARRGLPLLAAAALANCPDLDFALVVALRSRDWHRGFTHSLAFAAASTLCLLAALGWRKRSAAFAYGLAFASHGLLDFATTKMGGGVELLWPFTNARYGLGAFGLSELPSRMPPTGVLRYLLVECAIFLPPLLLICLLRWRTLDGERMNGVTR